MANQSKKQRQQHSLKEYVTVAFAEDMDLAKQYKQLLAEDNITAIIKAQPESSPNYPNVAVMVQEDDLDEAHILIESKGAYNDFYDLVFQDDGDDEESYSDEDGYEDEL